MKNEDLMKNPFMSNMKFQENMNFLKEESEFDRIINILTVPAKSGIYISKMDLRDIGLSLGIDVPLRERKEMLKDLFYYSKQVDKMKEFLDRLIEFTNHRISQYKEIQEDFPVSHNILSEWVEKAKKLIEFIESLKKEIDIYKV